VDTWCNVREIRSLCIGGAAPNPRPSGGQLSVIIPSCTKHFAEGFVEKIAAISKYITKKNLIQHFERHVTNSKTAIRRLASGGGGFCLWQLPAHGNHRGGRNINVGLLDSRQGTGSSLNSAPAPPIRE
jgi:hypothetical protein